MIVIVIVIAWNIMIVIVIAWNIMIVIVIAWNIMIVIIGATMIVIVGTVGTGTTVAGGATAKVHVGDGPPLAGFGFAVTENCVKEGLARPDPSHRDIVVMRTARKYRTGRL